MLSAKPKAEANNTYRLLDYLGYHKNRIYSRSQGGELKKLTPTDPTTPRTTLRTTPWTTLRTSPRTTMRTTLTNQPNLLSRRKELEEAYLPTRSHLINSRHLDFRHFTRPSPSSSLLRPLQLPFLDRHATLLSKPRVTIQITTACPT